MPGAGQAIPHTVIPVLGVAGPTQYPHFSLMDLHYTTAILGLHYTTTILNTTLHYYNT